MQLEVTEEQLHFIRNYLLWRSCYAPYGEVMGNQIWKPYMNDLLQTIEHKLSTHE